MTIYFSKNRCSAIQSHRNGFMFVIEPWQIIVPDGALEEAAAVLSFIYETKAVVNPRFGTVALDIIC